MSAGLFRAQTRRPFTPLRIKRDAYFDARRNKKVCGAHCIALAQSRNTGEPLCPIATTGAAGTNFPITRTQMYTEACQPGKLLSEEKSLVSISVKKV
jgi:hypothetical protein